MQEREKGMKDLKKEARPERRHAICSIDSQTQVARNTENLIALQILPIRPSCLTSTKMHD